MISVDTLVAYAGPADWSDETVILEVSDEMQRAIERARERLRAVAAQAVAPVLPRSSPAQLLTAAPAGHPPRAGVLTW